MDAPTSVRDSDPVQSAPEVTLLVADEFRSEQNGKVFAIGLYADRVLLVEVPPNTPQPTPEVPYGLERISFLINVRGVSGRQQISVQIGEGSPERQVDVEVKPGGSANLIFSSQPLLIRSLGKKTVTVKVAESTHVLDFELRLRLLSRPAGQ